MPPYAPMTLREIRESRCTSFAMAVKAVKHPCIVILHLKLYLVAAVIPKATLCPASQQSLAQNYAMRVGRFW